MGSRNKIAHCYTYKMRVIFCILAVLVYSTFALDNSQVASKFQEFKVKFNKVYSSRNEEQKRLMIFTENFLKAEEHNQGNSLYTRGINQFSDLTQEEFEDIHLTGYKRMVPGEASPSVGKKASSLQLPESVDWREKNAVTDMKDQGACGSCWAFAATEQIESYTAIASGELVELSTQQMTSCAPNPLMCGGNGGCSGSTPPLGYNYIQLFGHIKEEDYPYTSGSTSDSGSCQYDLSSLTPVASISGYDNLPSNDQDAVMSHIANVGPLAISVAANTFKDYHGGIFTGCDYDENIQLNHGVQLVGYGSEDGTDFWIVRNSWGSGWGESGYIRMLREANPGCGTDTTTSGHVCAGGPGNDVLHVCGMCGMLFETSYPLGAKLL